MYLHEKKMTRRDIQIIIISVKYTELPVNRSTVFKYGKTEITVCCTLHAT